MRCMHHIISICVLWHDNKKARVEQVLSPQAPMEPLPLPDYLNCLCTVEQQTAALFGMLKASKQTPVM